jgi:replicative DNA helicase
MTNERQSDFRLPPHSIEAEQSVLGGLLRDNKAWDRIFGRVNAGDFYQYDHRKIFQAIEILIGADKPADLLTVFEQLDKPRKSGEAPSLDYLNMLARASDSTANIARYADIVRNRRVLRELITAANDICNSAYEIQDEYVTALLESAEAKILAVAGARAQIARNAVLIDDPLTDAIEELDARYSSEESNRISGMPTGLRDLDRITSGFQAGDLVVVAGRPSMGKTSLAVGIGQHVASELNLPVLIFTLEAQAKQLAERLICLTAPMDTLNLRRAELYDEDWPLLTNAIQKLGNKPLYIDDTPGLTRSELVSRARRFDRQQGKAGLIIVDYLQLMADSHRDSGSPESRAAAIGAITRSLKNLAKELKCPVVALSQVNRAVESRPNKRPLVSDLRDAGAIEEDADVVIFVYRDEVYNPASPDRGTAEVIIGKQRNGPLGAIRTIWQGNYSRFENYPSQKA